jgi:hypothetical protein
MEHSKRFGNSIKAGVYRRCIDSEEMQVFANTESRVSRYYYLMHVFALNRLSRIWVQSENAMLSRNSFIHMWRSYEIVLVDLERVILHAVIITAVDQRNVHYMDAHIGLSRSSYSEVQGYQWAKTPIQQARRKPCVLRDSHPFKQTTGTMSEIRYRSVLKQIEHISLAVENFIWLIRIRGVDWPNDGRDKRPLFIRMASEEPLSATGKLHGKLYEFGNAFDLVISHTWIPRFGGILA